MTYIALKDFPFSRDGVNEEQAIKGQTVNVPENLVAGLVHERFIAATGDHKMIAAVPENKMVPEMPENKEEDAIAQSRPEPSPPGRRGRPPKARS